MSVQNRSFILVRFKMNFFIFLCPMKRNKKSLQEMLQCIVYLSHLRRPFFRHSLFAHFIGQKYEDILSTWSNHRAPTSNTLTMHELDKIFILFHWHILQFKYLTNVKSDARWTCSIVVCFIGRWIFKQKLNIPWSFVPA